MASAFREAIETALQRGDPGELEDLLAEDVVFSSPVVYKPYQGRAIVAAILRAVGEVFEDFRYETEIDSGQEVALIFAARVGDKELQGLDLVRMNDDGKVAGLTVMVRPMSGMLALAEAMKAKLEAAGAA